jgi:hypothetical protein
VHGEPVERLAPAAADLAREGPAVAGESVLPAGRLPLWKRVLPFAIALGLLGVVFGRTDLRAARESLGRVNGPAFVGFALVFLLALLAADVFATLIVYRPVLGRIRFRDLFVVRGASYLPSMLNHHVGQAFVTVFLSRSHGVPLSRVAGGTIVVYASWAACLLLLGGGAVIATGSPAAWLALPLGAGLVYLGVLAVRPGRLARIGILSPLFEAGVRGHLVAALSRVPHAAVLFLGTWMSFRFFGVAIPAGAALAYVPILMVVVTLPLTPQGFGTRDLVAATLFLRFVAGSGEAERRATIAAATASWGVVLTVLEAVMGLLLLRRATLLLREGREGR